MQKQIATIKKAGKNTYDSRKEEKELGSKSVKEMVAMTPDANPKEAINNFFDCFLKKIGIVPIIVEKPAKKVKRKEIIYISPLKYMISNNSLIL